MKRLIQFGFALILIAAPCWGGGKDDFKAAEDLWNRSAFVNSSQLYEKAILSGELCEDELVTAHYNRAISFFFMQQVEEAIKEINQLLRLQPDYLAAYSLRASSWVVLGKLRGKDTDELALADWAKVLELDPNDAISYNDRGKFYAEKGKLDKAIEDMERYLKLEPNSREHIRLLEELKAALVEQQPNNKKIQ